MVFLMVKKVIRGRDFYVTIYCFHDENLQRRIETLPKSFKDWTYKTQIEAGHRKKSTKKEDGIYLSFPQFRDLILLNDNLKMRETLYNDLLLKIAQNETDTTDHIRPVQFVHEWGSVSIILIVSLFYISHMIVFTGLHILSWFAKNL